MIKQRHLNNRPDEASVNLGNNDNIVKANNRNNHLIINHTENDIDNVNGNNANVKNINNPLQLHKYITNDQKEKQKYFVIISKTRSN